MKLLSFLLFFHCIAALPATHIDTIPKPAISNLISSGTGCPSGTVATVLTTANSTTGSYQMVNTLDAFTPIISPGVPVNVQGRNCMVTLDIGVPSGWKTSVNVRGGDVKGYLLLDDKTTGVWKASYSFASITGSSLSSLSFRGPIDGRFLKHVDAEGQGTLSPCGGGTLNVAYQIRLITTGTSWPGYIGPDPELDALRWVVVSGVEVMRC